METKNLYRSNTNKMLAGICGGIGQYVTVDPTVIRVLWMLLTLLTGIVPGVLIYIICLFIIPARPLSAPESQE